MPADFLPMDQPSPGGRALFLSASIPDPERWSGPFDALEVTDAVVALARASLTRGYALVTAAHPTIAPLLLRELPSSRQNKAGESACSIVAVRRRAADRHQTIRG